MTRLYVNKNLDSGAGGAAGAAGGGTGAGGGGAGAAASAGGAGGAPTLNDFIRSLPTDLQSEACLKNMDSPTTLAKGYVHAQKLIGAKRVAAPEPTWADGQWNEFYEAVGRPKTPGDYVPPKIEGVEVKTDDPRWKQTADALHKAGLTQKQAEIVLSRYYEDTVTTTKSLATQLDQRKIQAETALKTEWGDQYDINVNLAKATVNKFADPEFVAYINEGGGNDPRLIKVLANIGKAMIEDTSRGGSAGQGMIITDATRAQQELGKLKGDPEFMKAFTQRNHPNHKRAVEQMLNLQKMIMPGKQQEQ